MQKNKLKLVPFYGVPGKYIKMRLWYPCEKSEHGGHRQIFL